MKIFKYWNPQIEFVWVYRFVKLTPSSVAAGRYTKNSASTLNFGKK